jgi:hypothetical protein
MSKYYEVVPIDQKPDKEGHYMLVFKDGLFSNTMYFFDGNVWQYAVYHNKYSHWLRPIETLPASSDPSVLVESLEKIINPILFLRKEAEAEGGTLDGRMAIQLADDTHWLRDIAEKALNTYKESKPIESKSLSREQAEKIYDKAFQNAYDFDAGSGGDYETLKNETLKQFDKQ